MKTVMKTVLIISPHFPPINAADHHRVRMAVPFLPQFGWKPIVLAVDPAYVEGPRDEWLLKTMPSDLEVHRVSAWSTQLTRKFGMSTLAMRCRGSIRRQGSRILSAGGIDLIYFSTTQVGVQCLGPYWQRKFGVPFAFDLQDPWVNDYYSRHPEARPPGGRLKYGLAQFTSRRHERVCVKMARAVTTVSPQYIDDLARRYPGLDRERFHVLPFGAAETDFETARQSPVAQKHIDFNDGLEHWVSVGRGGADLHFAARALFRAFATARREDPERFKRVLFHFLGTDYAAGNRARETLRPVAAEEGVGDVVHEQPERIPYSEAVSCLTRADRLIVLGSDDSRYNPSKIAPYLFSRRPVLAILHEAGLAVPTVRETGEACVAFRDNLEETTAQVLSVLREKDSSRVRNDAALEDLSALSMTRRLAKLFDGALN